MKESEIIANKIRSCLSYQFISEKDYEYLKKLFREAEAAKEALKKIRSVKNVYDANMMTNEAQGCDAAEKILDDELRKAADEPIKPQRPKQATCKTCRFLDLNDRSSTGYKCHRPRWIFRKPASSRKQKANRACTAYQKREN